MQSGIEVEAHETFPDSGDNTWEREKERERERMRASKFYSKEVYTKREEEEEDLPAYPWRIAS